MEQWKVIDEFPAYAVSDAGRVRNVKTGRINLILDTALPQVLHSESRTYESVSQD